MSLLERYDDKFIPEPNTGCLIWTGATNRRAGKPRQPIIAAEPGKSKLITRRVCEEVNGPPPTSKHQAAHNTPNGCIGSLCVNGNHLRWASQSENAMDIPRKERSQRSSKGAKRLRIYDLPICVTFSIDKQKYRVVCSYKHIGYFSTVEMAVSARDKYWSGEQ